MIFAKLSTFKNRIIIMKKSIIMTVMMILLVAVRMQMPLTNVTKKLFKDNT